MNCRRKQVLERERELIKWNRGWEYKRGDEFCALGRVFVGANDSLSGGWGWRGLGLDVEGF